MVVVVGNSVFVFLKRNLACTALRQGAGPSPMHSVWVASRLPCLVALVEKAFFELLGMGVSGCVGSRFSEKGAQLTPILDRDRMYVASYVRLNL